jgi:inositol phosphorylceramide mannosyltransferase catalytic subunit
MIPKIIHFIWIGEKKIPDWINTWIEKNPNFKYKIWNEEEINKFKLENRHQYDKYYKSGNYSGASNIVRYELLNRFGGVYIDADTECLKPINNKWLNYDFVGCKSPNVNVIATSILFSKPNNPILKEIIKQIKIKKKLEPSYKNTGSFVLTPIIKEDKGNNLILESEIFYPMNIKGKMTGNIKNSYAIQYWGTTKGLYK